MPTLRIDNRDVTVPAGATLLAACRQLGIVVPTLCQTAEQPPLNSCMVCQVRDVTRQRFLPACAAPAEDGMIIESDSPAVHELRRTALELLLSEHVGDCEGPCHRICPAHLNIPRLLRQIAANQLADAIVTVKQDIALPAILGRICSAPCEKGCRRGKKDSPLAICLLKRFVADLDLAQPAPYQPPLPPPSGKTFAIVGAGPAGLAAAWELLRLGHRCVVFDRQTTPGGALRHAVPETRLPRRVVEAEVATIAKLGAEFRCGVDVGGTGPTLAQLRQDFAAVLLAPGHLEPESVAQLFGVAITAHGIRTDPHTHLTSLEGVFAAGAAVHPGRQAVIALAAGKAVARAAHDSTLTIATLPGVLQAPGAGPRAPSSELRAPSPTPRAAFDSHLGLLQEGEVDAFMPEASAAPRLTPAAGAAGGFAPAEAQAEARRCLHCDCRRADDCQLRHYATEYGVTVSHHRPETRPRFEQLREHAEVLFEPGKCIKCGRCVRITQQQGEPLGLTFTGRGFNVRVTVPFNEPLTAALRCTAAACLAACPTGALAPPSL